MKRFIAILKFMTTIKIKGFDEFDPDFHKAIVYFPLVGFVIGLIDFLIFKMAKYLLGFYKQSIIFPKSLLGLEYLFLALIVLFTYVILSGALHLDGFSDTFDGLFSNRSKEEILEILKDSRVGNTALIASFFLLSSKLVLLSLILALDFDSVVLLAPAFARLSAVFITIATRSPRKAGMGNLFIGKASMGTGFIASVYCILISIVGIFVLSSLKINIGVIIYLLLGLILIYLYTGAVKRLAYNKIDGITGDIIGFSIELGELVFLLYSFLFLPILIRGV